MTHKQDEQKNDEQLEEHLDEYSSHQSFSDFVYWIFSGFLSRFNPSYEEMVRQKEELKSVVLYWRYPDGSLVPPSKRGKLMGKLNRMSRHIRNHPDNPDNQKKTDN